MVKILKNGQFKNGEAKNLLPLVLTNGPFQLFWLFFVCLLYVSTRSQSLNAAFLAFNFFMWVRFAFLRYFWAFACVLQFSFENFLLRLRFSVCVCHQFIWVHPTHYRRSLSLTFRKKSAIINQQIHFADNQQISKISKISKKFKTKNWEIFPLFSRLWASWVLETLCFGNGNFMFLSKIQSKF